MLISRVLSELELLKRHVIVLKKVMDGGPIGIVKLSNETDIPVHLVRYSLRVLEQKGLVNPSTQGAVATKSARETYSELRFELEKIRKMTAELGNIASE